MLRNEQNESQKALITRRNFAQKTLAGLAGLGLAPLVRVAPAVAGTSDGGGLGRGAIRIARVTSDFERDPLIRPFGFKGGFMTEIWQTAAMMESEAGTRKIGICTQNVLWSDAKVFADHSESGGNAIMYAMTERALRLAEGRSFNTPVDLLDDILDEVYEYGQAISGNPELRKTSR